MITLFSSNYLSRTPIDRAMQVFGQRFHKKDIVIDLGCGDKPYEHYFSCKYIGVDQSPVTKSDIKADAWKVPLPDESADGIILNQSLEHIPQTVETVREIHRLLKPNGFVFVSVPQTMRTHDVPIPIEKAPVKDIPSKISPYWKVDYYRFTKYGLLYLFRDFTPLTLYETRTTFSTLIQHVNYFLAALGLGWIPAPIYFVDNILALAVDGLWTSLAKLPFSWIKRFDELVVRGLTVDYVFIAQKK